jgi:hypothetical protein
MWKSDTVKELQAKQGWSDETILDLAMQFLDENGFADMFDVYLEKRADEENAECGSDEEE